VVVVAAEQHGRYGEVGRSESLLWPLRRTLLWPLRRTSLSVVVVVVAVFFVVVVVFVVIVVANLLGAELPDAQTSVDLRK